jgi:hypothetical protein
MDPVAPLVLHVLAGQSKHTPGLPSVGLEGRTIRHYTALTCAQYADQQHSYRQRQEANVLAPLHGE